MSVVRLVRFTLSEGKEGVAGELAVKLVPQILTQAGCQGAFAISEPGTREAGLVVTWATPDDADAAAPVIGPQLMRLLGGAIEGPPDIRLFDILAPGARIVAR